MPDPSDGLLARALTIPAFVVLAAQRACTGSARRVRPRSPHEYGAIRRRRPCPRTTPGQGGLADKGWGPHRVGMEVHTTSRTITPAPPAVEAPRLTSVDIDVVPAVDALLTALRLGPFDRDSVTSPIGRNDVWAGRTHGGTWVFVKRLVGLPEDAQARIRRTIAFERLTAARTDLPRGPALLGHDDAALLLAFEYLPDARTGAELLVTQTFDDALAHAIGTTVGRLHSYRPDEPEELDRTPPALPSLALLRGLPQAVFDNSSYAELAAWRLMQRDERLVAAVEALLRREQASARVPAHCDLRVDQILLDGDQVLITDWEEFRLADPARDVGSFAGEWLYRAVLDAVTARGDAAFTDAELTHESMIERGVRSLARLRPRITAFWRGYREACSHVDDELAVRATAFAGWHLLDRMIAGAAQRSRLLGIERAAAGIGRTALCAPQRFVTALGLGDAP